MYDSPIFVLANPRSGSSVFRLILNSTHNSVFPPECGFIQWLYEKYKDWNFDKVSEFSKDVIASKKMEGWDLSELQLKTYIEIFNPKSYAEACYLVYRYYGELAGKDVEIWGDKNNYYIHHLDTISEIYPNAKYIWLKRNPKDICSSYLRVDELPNDILYKPKLPNLISDIFKEIKQNNEKIDKFLNKIEDSNKILVNFEDILQKNEKCLINISNFTNIDMNKAIFNFNNKKYFDEPKITMAWKSKTEDKLDESYINTYKLHPKSNEIESIYNKMRW